MTADRTRAARPRIARRAATIVAAALAASVILGCGGGGAAQGLDRPPESLDPASPQVSAENLVFEPAELTVPAGTPFVIVFENRDALQHNISIDADGGERRFEGVLFGGPAVRWYPVVALAPGSYRFVCDLHPTMTGRLVAT